MLARSSLVVAIGEFGRSPRLGVSTSGNGNAPDGRDHWPKGFSCVIGGGGLRSGVVIGETEAAEEPKSPRDPIEVADLCATILKQLGVEYDKEVLTPIGRPMKFSAGKPIERLLVPALEK